MIKLIFRYKNQNNVVLFKLFDSSDEMYKFIKNEDIEVENVEELY